MKIAVASGTRADWGLLRPLADELRRRGEEPMVVTTNMHSNPAFGNSLGEIRADGYEPVAGVEYVEGASATVGINTLRFGEILRDLEPDCLVLLGDRIEMLGVASAALVEGVPIVHIAGGTVSEGAIDDSIRHAISKMSTLHLVETEKCRQRLLRMGENPGMVHVCGAPGVWNSLNRKLMTPEEIESRYGFDISGRLLVVTLHAATRESRSPKECMGEMLSALDRWMQENGDGKIILTWPNNDVDPMPQVRLMDQFAERWSGRAVVIPSLGALGYLSVVAQSAGVVGNSSSGLVEIPSLRVPTLNIGIRQRGREHGPSVVDCGSDRESIYLGLERICSEEVRGIAAKGENPYYQAGTPVKMADAILGCRFERFPVKGFSEQV